MPQKTATQFAIAKSGEKETGKAHINAIMVDTPLFAGLDDYILKQAVRMEAETVKADLVKKRKKSVQQRPKKSTSDFEPLPQKAAKTQKTASEESNSMLLSVTEICTLLKISRATLVRMDKSGQLPGRLKLGGSVRFHRETVENWVQSLITTLPTPP